jgi:hypothetical protein
MAPIAEMTGREARGLEIAKALALQRLNKLTYKSSYTDRSKHMVYCSSNIQRGLDLRMSRSCL